MFTKDTARLVVNFKDFDGNSIKPNDVTLTIYDEMEEVLETITENIVEVQDGYHYDYVLPEHSFTFEFKGMYNDYPVLARQFVKTKFN